MTLIRLILQMQYEDVSFDPANVYLAISTLLLAVCVYFLKRHVEAQDQLNKSVNSLALDIGEIKTNSGNTIKQVEHLTAEVEAIRNDISGHDTEIKLLKQKVG